MLRMTPSVSAQAAQSYFGSLHKGDYYANETTPGYFAGKAADRLGLTGPADPEHFAALCDNRNPLTGERLTQRTRADRTVGWDLTFNAPKSVSLVHALTGDERILTAFKESVRETMEELEIEAKTRVRKDGQNSERTTGNLMWCEFYHGTSRPIDNVPDPQLHCHAYTFNVTWDAAEESWKALQARDLKRDMPYFEAAFHARLAGKVADLGYGIDRTKNAWEISGIERSTIEKFSRRTNKIEEVARASGITDPDQKGQLGAKTRQKKQDELPPEALRAAWDSRLTPAEREALRKGKFLVRVFRSRDTPSTEASVDHALLHVFELSSVVSEKQLLATALKRGVGSVDVEEVKREMNKRDIIRREVDGRALVTTREVLAEESRLIAFARDGRGSSRSLAGADYTIPPSELNDQQRAALSHLLTSRDRVMLLRGAAGTGKTSLMKATAQAIEDNGKQVFAFAPTAEASRGVLRKEGFAEADTLARLFQDKELQQRLKGQVIWVDEAGLVGTKDLGRVFALAEEHDARVILSGDPRQHSSVPRGDAFRLLQEQAGLVTAELQDIRRQQGEYRAAVAALSRGDVEQGLERLDKMGFVREAGDDQRHQQLADDYLAAVRRDRSVLVVSPTHAEGRRVTVTIRSTLRQHGRLGEEEKTFRRSSSFGLTEAMRQDAFNYREGDIVQFHQNSKGGFCRGERVTVAGADQEGRVFVQDGKGERRELPLAQAKHFDLYESGEINLARGDWVRIAANGYTADKKHRLNNGALYQVEGFTETGDMQLKNGWVASRRVRQSRLWLLHDQPFKPGQDRR